jgi:hypothetical protein
MHCCYNSPPKKRQQAVPFLTALLDTELGFRTNIFYLASGLFHTV